jgi:dephospho-CoA kinase
VFFKRYFSTMAEESGTSSTWFGVTGCNAGGKTTICQYLVEKKGFKMSSCSDSIRAWLREQGMEICRENLIQGGRTLRGQGGGGVLAEMLLKANEGVPNFIIDSVRTPDEVIALKKKAGFKLIEVRATRANRWDRMLQRGRKGDPTDYDTFVAQEEAELTAKDSSGQNLNATAALADIIIENDGDIDALNKQLDQLC